MPKIRCLFARPDSELHALLLADRVVGDRVHVLPTCDGITGGGLTVVRLPDPDEPWPDVELERAGLTPAIERFPWLRTELLAPELLQTAWAIAQATNKVLGWFYWHERGDDLYEDAALVLDPRPSHAIRPWLSLSVSNPEAYADVLASRTGRWLYLREALSGDDAAAFDLDHRRFSTWHASPLAELANHLDLQASTQYFVPEDRSDFDWARYRLR